MMGRGLLSRSMNAGQAGKPAPYGFGAPTMPQMGMPPQMGAMGRGMPNAFGGNPQFMQQLQQMMAMQPFTAPPRVGMPTRPGPAIGGNGPLGGALDIGGGAAPGMVNGMSYMGMAQF